MKMMIPIYLLGLVSCKALPPEFIIKEHKNGNVYQKAAVTTEIELCSLLGKNILSEGGNAVDAGIASAICVGTINSFSSGIGGGGFALLKTNGSQYKYFDYRESAPAASVKIPYEKDPYISMVGGKAVCVPGEIKGFYEIHKKYGKLPWKSLFTENIDIALNFKVNKGLERRLEKFSPYIFNDPGMKSVYTKDSKLVKEGEFISRPRYAKTLEKISNDPMSFYSGEIAKKMIKSIRKNGGVMTLEDLQRYEIYEKQPLFGTYKDYKVITTPVPTSGLSLLLGLNILENIDTTILKNDRNLAYHVMVEIFKFMSSKIGALGDPNFVDNRKIIDFMTSKPMARRLAQKINKEYTLPVEEYKQEYSFNEHYGTTHINIKDVDGMLFQITSSVNLEFGAKFLDEETGIIFNNDINDFFIPGHSDSYTLNKTSANLIQPGKRPFSSIAPVILEKDDELIMVGAAGGSRIPTSVFSILLSLFLGDTLEEAIDAPRIHHQLTPNITYIEQSLPKKVEEYLNLKGQQTKISATNALFTSVQGIAIYNNNYIVAYSDKRKNGVADGY